MSTAIREADLIWGTTADAARWLAETGLGGRYRATTTKPFWEHWTGTAWEPCATEAVTAAVRLALEAVYDRRAELEPVPRLLRLLNVNWRLGPLLAALRRELAAG